MLSTLKATAIILFMVGDVMLGRGIDQVLPTPSNPRIHEPYLHDARGYLLLAEQINGPIARPVDYAYVWGDALGELKRLNPDLRLINLETAVTKSDDYWRNKGINYRMHPENIRVLRAAGINACSLANNHVLDWGYPGLQETLNLLTIEELACAGAGSNLERARAPAVIDLNQKGRVLLFALAHGSSGVPVSWAARAVWAGINLLPDLSEATAHQVAEQIANHRHRNDLVVVSIHWGGNWGYAVPPTFRRFAHQLIDWAGVDIIHGHSSHHVKGIEVYHQRPILYGAGDFLNDYEGIGGHTEFRAELGLMYFASSDPQTGRLLELRMVPTRIRNFRIQHATKEETAWLIDTLNREGMELGTSVILDEQGDLLLRWD